MKRSFSEYDKKQVRLDTGISDAQMAKPMKTIYNRVIALAEEKPCVTGSYNLLITYYFSRYYGRSFGIAFKRLLELPSPESIGRAFRKAVENGEIYPSGKILKRRAQREEVFRAKMPRL